MVNLGRFLLVVLVVVSFGCGTQGGSSSSSSGTTGSTTDTTVVDVETDIVDGTSDVQSLSDLGESLTDIGDLVGSTDNTWWYSHAMNVSDDGFVVGQTNAGSIPKAAFLWDSSSLTMSFAGMHSGTYDGTNDFIYSEAVNVATVSGVQMVVGNSTTGTNWPDEEEKRAFIYNSATDTFIDIPPLDGENFTEAVSINSSGYVLVNADDADGRHAYSVSYSGGILTYERLGRILGEDSEAVAINTNNEAVVNSGGTAVFHDLDADAIEVLNFFPNDSETIASDLNNNGHVVGVSGDEGFFWRGGSMYPLGHLGGGSSEAVDINNNDVVVGNSATSSGTHAIRWSLVDGAGVMLDLGTLGGANSYAVAINDAGQVIGYSETGDYYAEGDQEVAIVHGFLWQDGIMYDLGTHHDFFEYPFDESFPMSEAVALGEDGSIVGNSLTINNHSRAFYLKVVAP